MDRTLVLLRHGESLWNRENRFTGWTDVELNEAGIAEAHSAAARLRDRGHDFDVLHTSLLGRAIETAHLVLRDLDRAWLPVRRSWRVNERHYGALQGLFKHEVAAREGAEAVAAWRRSYAVRPPALTHDDPRHPRHDARYRGLPPELLPATESLADVVARFLPYWYDAIVPDLRAGARVLVVAHGNSLRALVKHLEHIGDDDIARVELPTGAPLVYRLDRDLQAISHELI